MPPIPWGQIADIGGWAVAIGLTWLFVFSFIKGWIFVSKQVDEMIKPRDETIVALREENKSLTQQNHALLRESVATQNQFFSELKALREKP